MKKFLAMLLAIMMVLAMVGSASAATVINNTDHPYKAYQIFSGTQAEGSTILGDIEWGDGVNSTAVVTALQADTTVVGTDPDQKTVAALFVDVTDASAVAAILASDIAGLAKQFTIAVAGAIDTTKAIDIAATANSVTVDSGYYLIVDAVENPDDNNYVNLNLLQVTDTITIAKKSDMPSVEKKVMEETYTSSDEDKTKYGDKYNDVANYDYGDDVPFALYSKVPEMKYFDDYKFIFHDTMSANLSLNADSFKVMVDTVELANTAYTVKTTGLEDDGCTFEIEIVLKEDGETEYTEGEAIRVDYTAKLTKNAVTGSQGGEPNTVQLEYTNNPNDTSETGKTPTDTVIVFTYQIDVNKTKTDGTTKLADAKFVVYKVENSEKKYAKVVDGVTTWVAIDDTVEGFDWTTCENCDIYTSTTEDLISIKGIDAGTYYLKEIAAPAGYNKLSEDLTLIVSANLGVGQNWVGSANGQNVNTDDKAAAFNTVTLTVAGENGSSESGKLQVNVKNAQGGELPTTGGMGTTILYVIGGMMVLVAVVLLVTKRRAGAQINN